MLSGIVGRFGPYIIFCSCLKLSSIMFCNVLDFMTPSAQNCCFFKFYSHCFALFDCFGCLLVFLFLENVPLSSVLLMSYLFSTSCFLFFSSCSSVSINRSSVYRVNCLVTSNCFSVFVGCCLTRQEMLAYSYLVFPY